MRTKIPSVLRERSKPYEAYLLENLKDSEYAAGFLSSCLNAGANPKVELALFFEAVEKLVKAHGIAHIAEKMEVSRDTLYKIFAAHGNPTVRTLMILLNALGLKISIVPKK